MTNREPKLSRPSAATHHLTQASTTLNRRYVKRPQKITINHISNQPAAPSQPKTDHVQPTTPSRLVNLGVHAKDLSQPAAVETIISRSNSDSLSLHHQDPSQSATKTTSQSVAEAASQALAAIRTATAPEAAATQLDTLKAFAAEVKHHPASPELEELGHTIDQFVAVIEKSNHSRAAAEAKVAASVKISPQITRAAAKVTPSTTTTPKVAVSATPIAKSPSATIIPKAASPTKSAAPTTKSASKRTNSSTVDRPAQTHVLQVTANRRIRSTKTRPAKPSSKDIKDRAIKQALRSVATMSETPAQPIKRRKSGGAKRFILAFTCAAACLAAIIYLVSSNIPDVSVRVAAMQTGIEASYPSYVPMDYSLSDIISEDGKLTMIFNGPDGTRFTLVQEKSSWDSATLLRNYVEPTWGSDYVTTHEQGITIYISNQTNDSTWVNGGIRYSITSDGTRLTKKQTRNIVLSL